MVKHEFEMGRYLGPFTHNQIQHLIGDFQSSPLSIIPKPHKPGAFRIIQNFSFPREPKDNIRAMNTFIQAAEFPCTWGTFQTMCTLLGMLPPGS